MLPLDWSSAETRASEGSRVPDEPATIDQGAAEHSGEATHDTSAQGSGAGAKDQDVSPAFSKAITLSTRKTMKHQP